MKVTNVDKFRSVIESRRDELFNEHPDLSGALSGVLKLLDMQEVYEINNIEDLSNIKSSINLNEIIKVKLTDHGKDIYYKYHKDFYDRIGRDYNKDLDISPYPKIDEEGFTKFQLWEFMNIYGEHMNVGMDTVIKPLEIYFINDD